MSGLPGGDRKMLVFVVRRQLIMNFDSELIDLGHHLRTSLSQRLDAVGCDHTYVQHLISFTGFHSQLIIVASR
jgi:hypothetical protein